MFDTVELNTTFYRLPAASTVERWAETAPEEFVYAVKVGQYGSHRRKLIDPEIWLARHLDRVRGLGSHLGPNLVQLPPRWSRNTARLDAFLAACPKDVRWAVEIRDRSWLHDEVFETLARHDAALCVHDLIADHPWELTTDWTYLRFHGPDPQQPYHGRYPARTLEEVAKRVERWRGHGVDVYAYFNNDQGGQAPTDATRLRNLLEPAGAARFARPPPMPSETGGDEGSATALVG
jgi:uncharacterized protein YecE (DUF72 family)